MNKLLQRLLHTIVAGFTPAGVARDASPVEAVDAVTLPAHGWRSIARPAGLLISCQSGSATITQEHDPRDLVLVAGESIHIADDAYLIVQARQESDLHFETTRVTTRFV